MKKGILILLEIDKESNEVISYEIRRRGRHADINGALSQLSQTYDLDNCDIRLLDKTLNDVGHPVVRCL